MMAIGTTCRETERLQVLRNSILSPVKLFIAADIPQSVVSSLKKLQHELAQTSYVYPILRYTPQKTFHITLAYFGAQDMQTLEQIVKVCHDLRQQCISQIFTANLQHSRLELFGNTISKEKARMRSLKGGAALAITLQSNLYKIAQLLTQECKDLLHDQTPKSFTPHLTVGRIRIVEQKNLEKHERVAILNSIEKLVASTSVQVPNFTIPAFTLFESQGNGDYVPLVTCPLGTQ